MQIPDNEYSELLKIVTRTEEITKQNSEILKNQVSDLKDLGKNTSDLFLKVAELSINQNNLLRQANELDDRLTNIETKSGRNFDKYFETGITVIITTLVTVFLSQFINSFMK